MHDKFLSCTVDVQAATGFLANYLDVVTYTSNLHVLM